MAKHRCNTVIPPLITLIFATALTIVHASPVQHEILASSTKPFAPSPSARNKSAELLKIVCKATEYPQACFTAIWPVCKKLHYFPPKPDPVHFYNISLNIAMHEMRNITNLPRSLIKKATGKYIIGALKGCILYFNEMLDQWNTPFQEMRNPKLVLTVYKLEIQEDYISAALDDMDMCIEGLQDSKARFVNHFQKMAYKSIVSMRISMYLNYYLQKHFENHIS